MSPISGLSFPFSHRKLGLQVNLGPLMRNSEGNPYVLSLSSLPSENRQHPPKISLRSGKVLQLLFGYHMGKKICLLLMQDKLKLLISITEVLVLRKLAFLWCQLNSVQVCFFPLYSSWGRPEQVWQAELKARKIF